MTDDNYMRMALEEAEAAAKEGNAPFGVVVVDTDGEVRWRDHDRVKELTDPTAHGEINAIRGLCKKLDTLALQGMVFYTTSEPCPTCLTAMIKSKVLKNVYGANTEASASLPIPAKELALRSKKHQIEIVGAVLEQECLEQREKLRNI